LVKSNENIYPKGRVLKQMYRVVPIMKRGEFRYLSLVLLRYVLLVSCTLSSINSHI